MSGLRTPLAALSSRWIRHAHAMHYHDRVNQVPLLESLFYVVDPVFVFERGPYGVMQVQADVRTIVSRTFASRHSLRFPRVQRVRWDKSPMDIQTDQELWDTVESNQGAIVGEQTPPYYLHCFIACTPAAWLIMLHEHVH